MRKCVNCNSDYRSDDIYCRNCGVYIHKNNYYVFINILTYMLIIGVIIIFILFIASYFC